MTAAAKREGSARRGGRDRISIWEWMTAAVGLLLVLATVVVLVREGARSDGRPPQVEVRVVDVGTSAGGWVVRFEAHNSGDEVAANLELVGEIVAGDSVIESATATVDYLPAGSRRSGGMFFTRQPSAGTLRLRPLGYQKP